MVRCLTRTSTSLLNSCHVPMRKSVFAYLLLLLLCTAGALSFASVADALTPAATPAATPAPASNPSPVKLTPDQAHHAIEVLSDPKRRTQMEATLRAVAAAGALSA